MPLLDQQGRLFGRLNLLDAVLGVLVLVLIPLVYAASVLFRVPKPTIDSVTPTRLVVQGKSSDVLTVTGQNLRPFLHARVGLTELPFFVQSPEKAELKLLGIPPGVYDVALFDGAQELVRRPGAITIVAVSEAARPAMAMVKVRFAVAPEVLDAVKPGDMDAAAAASSDHIGATLVAVDTDRQRTMARTGIGRYSVDEPVVLFTATLRVPVDDGPTGLHYGSQLLAVGAPLTFTTRSLTMSGSVLSVALQPGGAPQP